MLRRCAVACSVLVLIASAVGCKRDLGECNLDGQTTDGRPIDGPAAFDVVYRFTDGLPMYEGQALVQSTCGAGQFCHSPAAIGADRIGVPAELDFDVDLACTGESQDPACAPPLESCQGGQTGTAYCKRLQRLALNQNQIRSWSEGMIQQMRSGAMPPGEAGRAVRDSRQWVRKSDGTLLPPIESSQAQDIVRNWLACQAPVIARTELAPSEVLQLEPCDSVDDETCIYRGPGGPLPDPVWSEIYWSLIFTQCVVCHGPANTNVDPNPDNPLDGQIPGGASAPGLAALDLTGSNTMDTTNWPAEAWEAVVGVGTADPGLCAGQGTLVIPNDSAGSVLIQKMSATQTCGDSMPLGSSVSVPFVQVVEEWIDMGAPND